MFFPRTIFPQLEKELFTRQIVVITGMRQVGKTTLLNQLFSRVKSSNKAFFDLENPLHRKVFEEGNYDGIWSNLAQFGVVKDKKAYLFLDEIQNLPQISSVVKYLYDHYQTKFFLTGSSSFYLKNLFPESLAGRKLIFELYPLTFAEFLTFKGQKKDSHRDFLAKERAKNRIAYEKFSPYYREFIDFGGFPAVVLEENQDKKQKLLEEIFKSYFEKDVKSLADFKEISKLRDLILLLVPRLASKVEVSKLASVLSVSRETVYNYLSFLEQTYFVSLLPQFSRSADRRISTGKKLFFSDTGLVRLLGQASLGQLFENSLFQSLRPEHRLSFFQKSGGVEIDFIVDEKVALEAKLTPSAREALYLQKRSAGLGLSGAHIISLNWAAEEKVILAIDI